MYELKYAQLEIGAFIRRRVIIELDVLRSYGCHVTYREHKGFLSTTLVDLRILGPKPALDAWQEWVRGVLT